MMTVPICDDCWRKQEGERQPVRFKDREEETCYDCGQKTFSGIYVRRSRNPYGEGDPAEIDGT